MMFYYNITFLKKFHDPNKKNIFKGRICYPRTANLPPLYCMFDKLIFINSFLTRYILYIMLSMHKMNMTTIEVIFWIFSDKILLMLLIYVLCK